MNEFYIQIALGVLIIYLLYRLYFRDGYVQIEARHPLPIDWNIPVYENLADDKRKLVSNLSQRYDMMGERNI